MIKKSIANSVDHWLRDTAELLAATDIPSVRLDAEVLLAHVLGKGREWLAAHSDEELAPKQVEEFKKLIARRAKREPVAYLVGYKEFYGRNFKVTPDVLIPRPETEDLVELALGLDRKKSWESTKVLDVGCGSGCVGITLKLEHPNWGVTLCDISPKALKVAEQNADKLAAEVVIAKSNLLSSFVSQPSSFSLIVANLPYVNRNWQTSPETAYEPSLALYADDGGLELVKKLIDQSKTALKKGGYLLLEADPEQHEAIKKYATSEGFEYLKTQGYATGFVNQRSVQS